MLPIDGVYDPLIISRREILKVPQGLARKYGTYLDLKNFGHYGTQIEKSCVGSRKPGNFHFFFVFVH